MPTCHVRLPSLPLAGSAEHQRLTFLPGQQGPTPGNGGDSHAAGSSPRGYRGMGPEVAAAAQGALGSRVLAHTASKGPLTASSSINMRYSAAPSPTAAGSPSHPSMHSSHPGPGQHPQSAPVSSRRARRRGQVEEKPLARVLAHGVDPTAFYDSWHVGGWWGSGADGGTPAGTWVGVGWSGQATLRP